MRRFLVLATVFGGLVVVDAAAFDGQYTNATWAEAHELGNRVIFEARMWQKRVLKLE